MPKTRLEKRIERIKNHEKKCCTGYTPAVHSANECVPFCDPACEFGTCTAPNTCTCHEGYIKHQMEANMYDCFVSTVHCCFSVQFFNCSKY